MDAEQTTLKDLEIQIKELTNAVKALNERLSPRQVPDMASATSSSLCSCIPCALCLPYPCAYCYHCHCGIYSCSFCKCLD